jgi:hypothetical protein
MTVSAKINEVLLFCGECLKYTPEEIIVEAFLARVINDAIE